MELRAAVLAQLQFTCSAGIAVNKLLAKVGSARHKPDKQTVVLPRAVPDLMQVSREVVLARAGVLATHANRPLPTCPPPCLPTACCTTHKVHWC